MARLLSRQVLPGTPGRLEVSKTHCRFCAKKLPPGRRNWCGVECVSNFAVRDNHGIARMRVLERDRGVCAKCGRDTAALTRALGAWLACDWLVVRKVGRVKLEARPRKARLARRRRALARKLGIRVDQKYPQIAPDGVVRLRIESLWDMDHITPVVEGGGACGLENLRTLCVCCHKKETRELAARRAALARRSLKNVFKRGTHRSTQ